MSTFQKLLEDYIDVTEKDALKRKEIEEKIKLLLQRMEALDDHIIARTGNQSGKMKVSLNLARAMVREQDFESTKAACAALKWVLGELDSLDYLLSKAALTFSCFL